MGAVLNSNKSEDLDARRFSSWLSWSDVLPALMPASSSDGRYVPDDFTTSVATGGEIERAYLAYGPRAVEYLEVEAPEPAKSFNVFFPSAIRESKERFPVVLIVNGTALTPAKYDAVFRHMASWGFVAIGNGDSNAGTGESTDASLCFLLREFARKGSVFYDRIDLDNIGATGHSQGGAGVVNVLANSELGGMIKTAAIISTTNVHFAEKMGFPYDLSVVPVPLLMLAGAHGRFETKLVAPINELTAGYERVSAPKVMARKLGCGHVEMIYSAEVYATAWFRAYLCGDEYARGAFEGESPELTRNELYSDQRIDL